MSWVQRGWTRPGMMPKEPWPKIHRLPDVSDGANQRFGKENETNRYRHQPTNSPPDSSTLPAPRGPPADVANDMFLPLSVVASNIVCSPVLPRSICSCWIITGFRTVAAGFRTVAGRCELDCVPSLQSAGRYIYISDRYCLDCIGLDSVVLQT